MKKNRTKKSTGEFEITKEETNSREKERINSIIDGRLKLTAKNDSQKALLKAIKENQITICNGVAGSGKTICSIYMALSLLMDAANKYQKIYLVKSVTTLKGEELGFIKGDIKEKVDPFLESFKLNAQKLLKNSNIGGLFDSSIIKFVPLAYIRGTNFDNCIVLVDEVQNISMDNSRTLLTRIGEDCKIICLGDTNQIDLRDKKSSSLGRLFNMLQDMDDIACVKMDDDDENCRNPIIKKIELKFKEENGR